MMNKRVLVVDDEKLIVKGIRFSLEACKSRGILIPEQIAIIGNDNIWCSKYIGQGLTTVEYPAKELGIRTMGMLLEALNHGGVFQEREVILQPSLCLRNTT